MLRYSNLNLNIPHATHRHRSSATAVPCAPSALRARALSHTVPDRQTSDRPAERDATVVRRGPDRRRREYTPARTHIASLYRIPVNAGNQWVRHGISSGSYHSCAVCCHRCRAAPGQLISQRAPAQDTCLAHPDAWPKTPPRPPPTSSSLSAQPRRRGRPPDLATRRLRPQTLLTRITVFIAS